MVNVKSSLLSLKLPSAAVAAIQLALLSMSYSTPDIVFILDLPAEMALERISKRGEENEKFEQLEFMKELRENFLGLKDELDDPIVIIDASKSKDEVFEQIKEVIDKII